MSEDIKARLRRPEENPEAAYQDEDLYHACAEAANRIEALEAALDEIAGVGFDAPITWTGTDAEWERRRANIMQRIARAALRPDREGE